jgi:nicotinamidase-related amidase
MNPTSGKALVVVDVQNEYVTPGRPFNIQSIAPSLARCADVLAQARSEGWPVAHVQHLQSGSIFAHGSQEAALVEGFEPRSGEELITKGDFSCYSAEAYRRFVATNRGRELVIVGYGATMCVLSTIIDGYHRGDKYVLVTDATAAKAAGGLSEEALHLHVVTILGTFARQTSTAELFQERGATTNE